MSLVNKGSAQVEKVRIGRTSQFRTNWRKEKFVIYDTNKWMPLNEISRHMVRIYKFNIEMFHVESAAENRNPMEGCSRYL